jgi:superfamily II DNA or RNA helicase
MLLRAARRNEFPPAFPHVYLIVYLSGLQLRPVEWLWQDRLTSGTLAMISREPGWGKTWVALVAVKEPR